MTDTKWKVGTSGWAFPGWVKLFYPDTLKASDLLPFYAHRFNTVEVNTTFYRFPPLPLVKGWVRKSPDDFVFSVKSSRYFTHLKRLRASDPIFQKRFSDFLDRVAPLGHKLGPIFFQLPPNLNKDMALLEEFVSFLPRSYQFVIEFRSKDWFVDEVFDLLKQYEVATCIISAPGIPFVPKATSKILYTRLHGARVWYNYHYNAEELKEIAVNLIQLAETASAKEIYIYFDNDVEANAIDNARNFVEILKALEPSLAASFGEQF